MPELTLVVGFSYPLVNDATKHTFSFHLVELAGYKGRHILWGEVGEHAISIQPGVRLQPSRVGCFVLMCDVPGKRIYELSVRLNGYKWAIADHRVPIGVIDGRTAIADGTPVYPVLNAGGLYGDPDLEHGWHQGYRDKDSMIKKATRLVDVYEYWRANQKRLPPWCKTSKPQATDSHRPQLWVPRSN